jgi:acyl-CoA hydrolase
MGRPTLVAYADGPDGPLPDPVRLEPLVGGPFSLLLGWVVRRPPWIDTTTVPVVTLMLGAGLRRAATEGRVRAVPTRLSAIPGLLTGRLRPDVVVVGATATATGGWRLVGSPGWALTAVRAAAGVIVERWSAGTGPLPAPGPELPRCRILGVVDRTDPPDPPPPDQGGSPEHLAIGRLVASVIPEGATVQWGPGAVGAAVIDQIDQPVGVWSGLVTGELVGLADRGLLVGPARAAYLWGGRALSDMVGSGDLRQAEMTTTHDMTRISAMERFVAVNTALQVGLDGAANVEVAGGRTVSGPGGHPDFAAGASRSPGGLSVVALTSTSGGRSNIVARPEVVTTPRCDIDVVVTEHGLADLRGLTPAERAERVAAVAAPEFRAALRSGSGA